MSQLGEFEKDFIRCINQKLENNPKNVKWQITDYQKDYKNTAYRSFISKNNTMEEITLIADLHNGVFVLFEFNGKLKKKKLPDEKEFALMLAYFNAYGIASIENEFIRTYIFMRDYYKEYKFNNVQKSLQQFVQKRYGL